LSCWKVTTFSCWYMSNKLYSTPISKHNLWRWNCESILQYSPRKHSYFTKCIVSAIPCPHTNPSYFWDHTAPSLHEPIPLPFNPHHVTLIFESCPVLELSLSSTDNSAPSSPSIRSPEIPPSSCEDQIQMVGQTQNWCHHNNNSPIRSFRSGTTLLTSLMNWSLYDHY
jgi:hypothetical protein